jgi:hypothetical protein
MTPREAILKALAFERLEKVPFTIYESKIPQCLAEREMRNRGLCIVNRHVGVFRTCQPNVKCRKEIYTENGREFTRIHYQTPVGSVSMLQEAAGFTSWIHERLFKSPDDYKVLKFMIEDQHFEPAYEQYIEAEKNDGGDIIRRAGIGLEPLQCLISGSYIEMSDFCIEWMDNRDEILSLYDSIVKKHREIYPLIADSPATHVNYGGNVVPEIVSPQMHEEYYLPHYAEAAECLRPKGIKLGSHYDANCRTFAKNLANSALDYIEAFTPAPDTDMTLKEAREAWPDKVLWLNFPSSVHLKSDEKVKAKTIEMLSSLASTDGIIMGITEDIPEHRWRGSCTAIMDGLEEYGRG